MQRETPRSPMEFTESSQGTSWEQPRRVQIRETQLLFSHHIFSLPHPLCCSVRDPLSCLLTFPLPRAAVSLIPRSSSRCDVTGGQFWVQTAVMQGQEHGFCSSPAQRCGRRRRRMAGWLLVGRGRGHSRSQSRERLEAKPLWEQHELKDSNLGLQILLSSRMLDVQLQYILFICYFTRLAS